VRRRSRFGRSQLTRRARRRIVDFVHTQGGKVGVQLAHAGRKASTYAPWVHSDPARKRVAPGYVAGADENGWPDNGMWMRLAARGPR
jgi:2,4-dienoyl-CoA reductase-like NADH-dependent reductase (Old Yellow Enzyme family)